MPVLYRLQDLLKEAAAPWCLDHHRQSNLESIVFSFTSAVRFSVVRGADHSHGEVAEAEHSQQAELSCCAAVTARAGGGRTKPGPSSLSETINP